jgi:preprotein translocase subunit SecD
LKDLKWREILVVIVCLVGIVYLVPSLSPSLPPLWSKFLPKEKIHLGLDLQGGMHLILEVEADKAVENSAERITDDLRETLRTERVPFMNVEKTAGWNIDVQLAGPEAQAELTQVVEKNYPVLRVVGVETRGDGVSVVLALQDTEVQRIRKMAEGQALETIRNRIDQFGVSEPDIRSQGDNRILIQLPGIQDPQRAIALIGKTALLEFKLVAEDVSPQAAKDGKLPPGTRVYPMRQSNAGKTRSGENQIVLKDRTLLTGSYITNAEVRIDTQYGTPYVGMDFDTQGAKIFEKVTGENIKKRLAIVLDGIVYSAPVIQDKIGGGKATITGNFSMEEARDLAVVLRAGALPAPVKILEQRTVGPSLGQDSIQKGILASLVGGIGIILFMIIYYRFSGVIADIALLLNIVLLLAGLAAFGATLTLPGIAGIALTIAIAVDANVLIYERIREELRLGKTPRAAVETGYSRAAVTILDSNITSLIAAAVLFQFGTGPIKGFAVTLSIGLIANLYTAIVVTRVIFDYLLLQRRVRTLSI